MKHINTIRRAMALVAVMIVTMATAIAQTAVNYIDKDGIEQTCETYIEVGTTTTAWNAGWYLVNSTLEISGGVTVIGAVHLILADGASLTVTGKAGKAGVNVSGAANSLTIYGQAECTGKLIANGMGYANYDKASGSGGAGGGAGIGGDDMQLGGNIIVNGGIVTANGGGGGAGIGGGCDGSAYNIEINRGTVTANGSLLSTGIGVGAKTQMTETDEWIDFNDPVMGVSGLPIWAKYNVGVDMTKLDAVTDWYGDYFAWGTTETWYSAGGQTSSPTWRTGYSDGYSFKHIPHTNGKYSIKNKAVFMKYVTQDQAGTYGYNGFYDNKTVLEATDDAATAIWCGTWRMPTGGGSGEWKQLKDNTYIKWTEDYKDISGLKGYIVYKVKAKKDKGAKDTAPSGESYTIADPHMFLPAAGYRTGTDLSDGASKGYYWSGSLYASNPERACEMGFSSDRVFPTDNHLRMFGSSVRPVRNTPNTTASLTLSIGENTVAEALGVAWKEDDVVNVYNGEEQVGTLNYRNHDGSTATFTGYINEGIEAGTELTFRRGATPAFTEQDGALATLQANYSLEGTAEYNAAGIYNNISMGVPYALMKLDLSAFGTADGTTVTISAGDPSETVASITGVTMSSTELYVAMPAAASREYTFSGNGETVNKTWTLEANKFYTKEGSSTGEAIVVAPPKFSVSATKTVKFAQGNLYWDGSKFHFEANQWDYRTWAGNSSCINGNVSGNGTPANNCGLFKWSNAANAVTGGNYYSGDLFCKSGFTVDGQAGWSTLSNDEWKYLLGIGSSYRDNASSLRGWRTVAGVPGLVILPDGSTTSLSSITTAEDLAAAGAVFLPAGGYRVVTGMCNVGTLGYYWSSTPNGLDYAYRMYFYSDGVYAEDIDRDYGYAVRLVR